MPAVLVEVGFITNANDLKALRSPADRDRIAENLLKAVKAFKKVLSELLMSSRKGSLTGYFSEPHKTECSKMWVRPQELMAGVRKAMVKTLFASSFSKVMTLAPVLSWR
jgi:hypothetical protein